MPPQTEVLLYSSNLSTAASAAADLLMEGALTSVYVFRNDSWVTPALSSGCQNGTTRRWALEQGLCSEANIPVQSLQHGELIWLSNGVRGFIRGVVVINN